jgi:hypothetical protein
MAEEALGSIIRIQVHPIFLPLVSIIMFLFFFSAV